MGLERIQYPARRHVSCKSRVVLERNKRDGVYGVMEPQSNI